MPLWHSAENGRNRSTRIGRDLAQCAIYGREGVTGVRDEQTIGFPPFAVETSSATTPCCLPVRVSASKSHKILFAYDLRHRRDACALFWHNAEAPVCNDMQDVLG